MRKVTMSLVSDTVLLTQISSGSIDSFDELFERYWNWAYAEAYKRIKDPEDAKDIVQDLFADIWNRREQIHIENFGAYLNVAIRNRVLKLIRKKSTQHPFFDHFSNEQHSAEKADLQVLWKEFAISFQGIVEALPPKRRAIFQLHYINDVPVIQIADQMGISRKTVQNQLTRAVHSVKFALSRLMMMAIALIFF